MLSFGRKRGSFGTVQMLLIFCLILHGNTAAVRLYSSSLLGFVSRGLSHTGLHNKRTCNIVESLPRRKLHRAHAFHPVQFVFDILVKIPKLLLGQSEQTDLDSVLGKEDEFEEDLDERRRREELEELEHWHYWTSEQQRLHEEKKTNQKLQWPEVVSRCVIEPLRKEKQKPQYFPSAQPTVGPASSDASHLESLSEEQRMIIMQTSTNMFTGRAISTADKQNSATMESKLENATTVLPVVNINSEVSSTTAEPISSTYIPSLSKKSPHLGRQQGRQSASPWSNEEESQLTALVKQHTVPPHQKAKQKQWSKPYIDWITIGKILHRPVLQCKSKYRVLCDHEAKKGRFSAQENALIRLRVAQWYQESNNNVSDALISGNTTSNIVTSDVYNASNENNESNATGDSKVHSMQRSPQRGLWADLDRELGRRSGSVVRHWRTLQKIG